MEVHPIQRFPSSETGRGLRKRKADEVAAVTTVEVKMKRNRSENDEISAAASPSINLGLQIGTNSAGNRNERTSFGHRKMEAVLTVGQLQELEQQVLIHKHLAAGLRVPTHLLVPIWKSVAKTLGSNVNGVNERCNGFIGYSPGLDYRSMMDPEPGRCRRTDGKKWRCSRDTIPDQKYCERHMHRGRQRSRKPVEASENDSPSKKVLLNTKTKNQFSCDFPPVLPFPSIEALAPGTKTVTETISSSLHGAAAIVSSCADATKTIRMIPSSAPNAPATYIMTIPSTNPATTTTSIPTSYDIFHLKDVRNMNFRESCCKSRDVFGRNDINVKRIQSPGLGFSPSSVLQVPGCSSSLCGSKINLELEPGRCRRTDGKKWRCRRDVIPNQKYCGLHMHRGSKKQMKPSQNAPVLASTRPPLAMMALTNPDPATPNTNLSMSIQPGNNRRQEEERSSNASSSSETTITDTTITG